MTFKESPKIKEIYDNVFDNCGAAIGSRVDLLPHSGQV
jgi:hypothetical protein